MNGDKLMSLLALVVLYAFLFGCLWLIVGCEATHPRCFLALVDRAGQCGPREHEALADIVHGCAAQSKSLDEEEVIAASNPACIDRAREAICPRVLGFTYLGYGIVVCTAPQGRAQDEFLPCSQAANAAEKEVCKHAPQQ